MNDVQSRNVTLVTVGVLNRSTLLSKADWAPMLGLANVWLQQVGAVWGVWWACAEAADEAALATYKIQFVIADGLPEDEPGALGYHTENADGAIRAYIAVKPVLDSGGVALINPANPQTPTVLGVLTHELGEALADMFCNLFAVGPERKEGSLYAYEICLAGDTGVRMASGETASIETLADRGGFFDVISADDSGAPIARRAGHARLTHRNAETVTISFTDGSAIRCTPSHKFLLPSGVFIEAGSLAPGTRLHSDTSPAFPASRLVDSIPVHAKASGAGFGSFRSGSEFDDLRGSQLRTTVRFAESAAVPEHPALPRRIEHVLAMSPKEKVSGTDAPGHIARVAHVHTVRNARAIGELVREPVRIKRLPPMADLSVSGAICSASPQPAIARRVDARPKRRLKRGFSLIVCRNASIESAASTHSRPMGAAQPLSKKGTCAPVNGALSHSLVVDRVEPSGKCAVYDLTVPGTRNFAIANGAFAHNCDPVEAWQYEVELPDGSAKGAASDWVYPAWFDVNAPANTQVDKMGRCTKPFEIASGGYMSIMGPGYSLSQIYGDKRRPWKESGRATSLRSRRRAAHVAALAKR